MNYTMKKLFKKSWTAFMIGILSLGGVSCENPLTFDIKDYTLTLDIQDGYMEEGELTYPQLVVLVEGPGANLWNLTVQSENGESMNFQAFTGVAEHFELNYKAFEEGETTLNISVTARESAHQELLDKQNLTAQIIPFQGKQIQFYVADEQTKASVVDENTLGLSGFNVSATTGETGNEIAKWTNVHFIRSGSVFLGEKWWPSVDPQYHFYASNADLDFSASGGTVTVSTDTDVVCAYRPTSNYEAPNFLIFNHILARLGTISLAAPSGYNAVINSITFTPITNGTYNIRTKSWSDTSTGEAVSLSPTSPNDAWCIPSTYTFTINYTLSVDDYSQEYTKTTSVTLLAGKTNNLSGTLPSGDAVRMTFTLQVTAWGSENHAVTIE